MIRANSSGPEMGIAMHRRLAATAALVLWSTLAYAHPGGPGHDFTHGFAHPIGGLDHVLAMVAVGLLAAQMGGRALWLVPGAFVVTMAVAAWFAMGLSPAPRVELGIAASVLMIGAAVALPLGLPASLAAAIVGAFAVFHGIAHGGEMPSTLQGLSYGLGFVAATVLLHTVGIGAGLLTHRLAQPLGGYAVRIVGGGIAVVGVMMIITGALA
jgi:urease accessory protein